MGCLDQRLTGLQALVEVLSESTGDISRTAMQAVNKLSPVSDCANLTLLRSAIPPPGDPVERKEVEQIRESSARGRALLDLSKQAEGSKLAQELVARAQALSYRPVQAETLELQAQFMSRERRFKEAEETLHRALWAAVAGSSTDVVVRASMHLTYVVGQSREASRGQVALDWAELGRAAIERLGGNPWQESALENARWAALHNLLRFDEAIAAELRSIELLKKHVPNSDATAARYYGNLSITYISVFRYGDAVDSARNALQVSERVYGREHPALNGILRNLGLGLLNGTGPTPEAEEVLSRNLVIDTRAFGAEHPYCANDHFLLGELYLQRGRYAQALKFARTAVKIHDGVPQREANELAISLRVVADALLATGNHAEAVELYRRALKVGEPPAELLVEDRSMVLQGLGRALQAQGKGAEARAAFARAVETLRGRTEEKAWEMGYAYTAQAEGLLKDGEPARAKEPAQKALQGLEAVLAPDSMRLFRPLIVLAQVRAATGDREGAVKALDRALGLPNQELLPPEKVGAAQLLLAKVLWEDKAERPRALALAASAKVAYGRSEVAVSRELAELEAWQRGR